MMNKVKDKLSDDFHYLGNSIIKKGGGQGAGLIKIEKDYSTNLENHAFYKIIIRFLTDHKHDSIEFWSSLRFVDKRFAFYLPKSIMRNGFLFNKSVSISVQKLKGFFSKIFEDQRIRIPNTIVEKKKIQHGDIYEIRCTPLYFEKDGNNNQIDPRKPKSIQIFVHIKKTPRSDSNPSRNDEYTFLIRQNGLEFWKDVEVELIRKIPKLPESHDVLNGSIEVAELFQVSAQIGLLDEERIIVFLDSSQPIIAPKSVSTIEMAFIMGSYYADGTKAGSGWSINASTPEQANYYIQTYKNLIYNHKLRYDLTYTRLLHDFRTETEIKNHLIHYWCSRIPNLELDDSKIYIIQGTSEHPLKFNECGSLRIRDHRKVVNHLYRNLLERCTSINIYSNSIIAMKNFIMGVIEGDGSAGGGVNRILLSISTNKNDIVIQKILKLIGMPYSIDNSKNQENLGKGMTINIGQLEILKDIEYLYQNLFKYYPKRRKKFFERLISKPAVLFLLGLNEKYNPSQKKEMMILKENVQIKKILYKIKKEFDKQ